VIRKALPLVVLALALGAATAAFARDQYPFELTVKGPDGKAVEGAQVTVEAKTGEAFKTDGVTNKKGRFEAALPDFDRIYLLTVTKDGYATLTSDLDLPSQHLHTGQTAEVGVSLQVQTPEQAFIAAYNQGVGKLRDRDADAALPLFEEAARIKPTAVEPWRVISQIYLEEKKFDEALAAADQALQRKADDGEALRDRYDALTALGRSQDAEAALDVLATSDHTEDTARLLFNSGAADWNAKNAEGARKRFGQALAIDPKLYQAHAALAEIHISESQSAADDAAKKASLRAAIEELDHAIEIAPRNFNAWERKIEVLKAMDDTDGAAAAQKQLDELKAGH
jgi:tetratricopeptide (TPR) repeat protein